MHQPDGKQFRRQQKNSSTAVKLHSAGPFTPHNEMFADCTVNTKGKIANDILDSVNQIPSSWVEHVEERAKREIKWSTPTPSQLWLKERKQGAPWREMAESKLQIEDEGAKKEIEKRAMSLLAKQTSCGLKSLYHVQFDAADLIPILEDGKRQRDSRSGSDSQSSKIYKAAIKFDIRAVLQSLEVKSKNVPPPRLGITRCKRPETRSKNSKP